LSRKKEPPGTFIYRELFTSKAFLSLRGFAPQLLILFLSKRKRNVVKDKKGKKKTIWIDDNINMTYIELEKKYGVSRPRIVRAIDALLAKGFIEIRHHGGVCQKDKTIYAMSEKYLLWSPGVVFEQRQYDLKRGYQGKKNKTNARKRTHTHARRRYPKTSNKGTETLPIGNKVDA
jgi:hypothetical protein